MSGKSKKAPAKAPAEPQRFSEMSGGSKIAFLGKAVVFVITFGFAFPTLFGD